MISINTKNYDIMTQFHSKLIEINIIMTQSLHNKIIIYL